jgi:ribosomal protein S9
MVRGSDVDVDLKVRGGGMTSQATDTTVAAGPAVIRPAG